MINLRQIAEERVIAETRVPADIQQMKRLIQLQEEDARGRLDKAKDDLRSIINFVSVPIIPSGGSLWPY